MKLSFALVAVLVIAIATALPFSAKSGVTELTPKNFKQFLNTHKPVFIMFYAPWCGHCKTLHPDWEKLGKSMKDVVRIGAVNADEHRSLGQQFGVQGFPTIKYWKMGDKKGMQPQDYQGGRTHGALHNAALAEIKPNVVTVASFADVEKKLAASSSGKAIVLASSKSKSPPMFSVMSQSPHFKSKLPFLLVTEKNKKTAEALKIEKFPTVMVVEKGEGEELSRTVFDGKIEYTAIAKWLQVQLGDAAAGSEEAAEEEKPKEKPKKNSQPATPVVPTALTKENFKTFCGPNAPKVGSRQPFCIVSLGENQELEALNKRFNAESVLFFFAKQDQADEVAAALSKQLSPKAALTKGGALAIRAAKDKVKFATWAADSEKTLESFVGAVAEGAQSLERAQGFPTL